MKVLFLDIEISPTLATVWGLFNQNITIDKITGNSEVLTWAAKWAGSNEVEYSTLGMTSKRNMLKEIYKLLEEADVVVTYNGDRFDLPILNQEFMLQGWTPPAPYRSLDILKTMKRKFRGTSNKLDYWLGRLGLGQKVKHRGHQMWLDCMNGDKAAFEEMAEYNVGDVVKLEELYDRILPWIHNPPNRSVYDEALVCPHCGGSHFQLRGWAITKMAKYRRMQCKDCGGWFRSTKNEAPKEKFALVS